jgi:hypothetical protein
MGTIYMVHERNSKLQYYNNNFTIIPLTVATSHAPRTTCLLHKKLHSCLNFANKSKVSNIFSWESYSLLPLNEQIAQDLEVRNHEIRCPGSNHER